MPIAPLIHSARAASHPDPDCAGVWQPRCTCGWRGELVADEAQAGWLAEAHRRYQTDDGAPVETLLERAMRDGGES